MVYLNPAIKVFLLYNILFFSSFISTFFFFLMRSTILLKKKKFLNIQITLLKKKNVIGLYYITFFNLLYDTLYIYKQKIRLLGLGYRFFFYSSSLYINAGMSNSLKIQIPLYHYLKIYGRKKNKLIIFSFFRRYVKDFLILLISYRFPNTYTGKGIFFYNKLFIKKKGKQVFSR
jgi:ribosomal protein L6P/L9E